MCRNFSKAKSCEAQYEYSRGNTHEDNMMREMKCSYCKHNLAYVSKIQTIHHFELMTYRCVYCGVNYKYHKYDARFTTRIHII
jgi:C4-type Zn-finger protein